MNKKLIVAAAGFGMVAAGFAGTAAMADPAGAPQYRVLAGGGSDTTEEVMQAMSEAITIGGTKVLGSYNATGGAFNSKDPAALPAGATTCNYAAYAGSNGPGIRPNGSGAGRDRLIEASTTGNERVGCLDFARSSSGPGSTPLSVNLTFIPFAVDAQTYAVRANSPNSRVLSIASLKAIYQCNPATTANFTPLLPQSGSGTRSSWLSLLGLTEATKGACVRDTWDDPNDGVATLVPIQEHDGRVLTTTKELVPFSAAQWSSQSAGIIVDKRGNASLAALAGVPAQAANAGGGAPRKVYNLVPTADVNNPAQPELNQVFVGSGSLVCQQTSVIGRYGFGLANDCGSTSLTQ